MELNRATPGPRAQKVLSDLQRLGIEHEWVRPGIQILWRFYTVAEAERWVALMLEEIRE